MKKYVVLMLFVVVALLDSCSDSSTYGSQLSAEKKLIKNYIERNNLNILDKMPEDGVWGEKDYLEIDENLYIHMVSIGDTTLEATSSSNISLRYRKYTLTEYSDTTSVWNTNDSASPIEFRYANANNATCRAWALALQYMRYHNSECKLICPSKLGFNEDANTVTPYGYDLKIKINVQ